MARGGTFKANRSGFLLLLNGPEMYTACDGFGHMLALQAATQSMGGADYRVDTIHGRVRIHTRVSTIGAKGYMQERNQHALAITAGTGSLKYRSAGSRRRR